ncbi:GTP-binding protein 2-like [Actinia tenebrosa]|uniref:GTP-binding protein 2-like n=1 Tax=Actinia tenebrosa TaxID=6105 RepID=A0A6P8H3B9_ACTTE|nr:GTP-binding protein 2-like [Actinia tenebrosa]
METFVGLFGNSTRNGSTDESSSLEPMPQSLPPEVEEGNVEYKLKLVNPSDSRLIHLTTQMKWRLQEGQGEAIYEIGVEDNGLVIGLPEKELQSSLKTLELMASKLGASTSILRHQYVDIVDDCPSRQVAEVLVRQVPDDQQFIDIRMAVLGNVDTGKSTLLGVLTHDELDNGHGRARLNLFRHLHEIQSGRTSSISHEILGFNSKGEVINYSDSRSAEDICEQSSKLITFIDLAGHHKYMKTTIFGLTGYTPDFAMLVIAGNSGIVGTTREHLGLAMALHVPTFVVISKMDICTPAMVQRTVSIVERILKSPGCNKVPLRVQGEDDAVVAAQNFASHQITPIFTVSCVTGENLDLLKKFLNMLQPTKTSADQERLAQALTQYEIDETFNVPGTGPVVLGTLKSGIIREGDKLVIGPLCSGEFETVQVASLKRNRASCRVVRAGQSASVALKGIERHMLRRGMVMADPKVNPRACVIFWAEVYLLFHHAAIKKRFQATVYVGNVIQNAIIIDMNKENLRTGQRAKVKFEFVKQPEFIREGARLLFREGHAKGIGQVVSVVYHNPERIER